MDKQIRRCIPCQSVRPPTHKEQIQPSELSRGPWQYVEMHLQGPYPNNEYVFVIIDRYSRWPELTVFKSTPNAGKL